MKQLTIIIPTRNRGDKLYQTLNTIPYGDHINTVVVCDGDRETYLALKRMDRFNTEAVYIPEQRGAVFCRNLVLENVEDGALCATDDVEFYKDSIDWAFNKFNELYPDDDGVVGFIQEGVPDYHPTGVVVVGQKFLQRYPSKHMYNPEYFHFSCQEIKWLADKVGKFHLGEGAKLWHWHPSFHKHLADETHVEARVHKKRDMALIKDRTARGLIWGDAG